MDMCLYILHTSNHAPYIVYNLYSLILSDRSILFDFYLILYTLSPPPPSLKQCSHASYCELMARNPMLIGGRIIQMCTVYKIESIL